MYLLPQPHSCQTLTRICELLSILVVHIGQRVKVVTVFQTLSPNITVIPINLNLCMTTEVAKPNHDKQVKLKVRCTVEI